MSEVRPLPLTPLAVLDAIRGAMVRVDPNLAGLTLEPETDFEHLGIPSIVMITIVFEIEEQFDVVIVDAGLDSFDTIGDLQDLVLSLVAQKAVAQTAAEQKAGA